LAGAALALVQLPAQAAAIQYSAQLLLPEVAVVELMRLHPALAAV
jgi:hypothetical protein